MTNTKQEKKGALSNQLSSIFAMRKLAGFEIVLYPFNDDIKETARKEADKQGLYFLPSQGNAENYFLSSSEMIKLRAAAENLSRARGNSITVNQVVWKESYTYDANGNRTSKTTAWGTISYSYDKENRLTESGDLGKSESVKYTYDKNGNLLKENSPRYRKEFEYNAQNRMSLSHVQDFVEDTRNIAEYDYDAFGRRVETYQYLGDYTRNLYDGFSFDIIGNSVLQSAYSANLPDQKYRTPNRQSATSVTSSGTSPSVRNERGTDIGTRYRYIDENPHVSMSETAGNTISSTSLTKTRSRPNNEYVLYSYGEPVAMSADGNASYFGSDILGSIRAVTDKYGSVQADYSYDAFGSPYLGNLENDIGFGYCGKVYDNGTGLYDYGFRDYSSNTARFTTIDPIRDGSNWFSYVVNDPVNYIDPFGLNANDVPNYDYKGERNGKKYYEAEAGATMWGLAHDTGTDLDDVQGYEGDPRQMPIGTILSIPSTPRETENSQINTIGQSLSVPGTTESVSVLNITAKTITSGGNTNSISTNQNKTTKSCQIATWKYMFMENIGVNGGASFSATITTDANKISMFVSGKFIADNLVNSYDLYGSVDLIIDGSKIASSNFSYPNYDFAWSGFGKVLGNAEFTYPFSSAKTISLDFNFGVFLKQDVQGYPTNYKTKRIDLK